MESSSASRPIVVVDDNPDDLFFFKRCLAKANVTNPLAIATDGEEALTVLSPFTSNDPAAPGVLPLVVFLDLKLPRLPGFAVLEWIRTQPAFSALPVAVLSSSAEPRDITRAYALGAQTYLVKHPAPKDMSAIVESVAAVTCAADLATLRLPGLPKP
jgi:CheY-like chemotaxis protein